MEDCVDEVSRFYRYLLWVEVLRREPEYEARVSSIVNFVVGILE